MGKIFAPSHTASDIAKKTPKTSLHTATNFGKFSKMANYENKDAKNGTPVRSLSKAVITFKPTKYHQRGNICFAAWEKANQNQILNNTYLKKSSNTEARKLS